MSKSANAARKFSRLRRIVSHERPGLEALEHHALVEAAVVAHRPAPLLVVVALVVGRRGAPPAAAAGRPEPLDEPGWHRRGRYTLAAVPAIGIGPVRQLALARTDTGRAARPWPSRSIAANVVALAFTVVFARMLGAYRLRLAGGRSMSAFIILMVPGSALQVAVAREVSARSRRGDARRRRGRARAGSTRLPLGALVVARGWRSRARACSRRS